MPGSRYYADRVQETTTTTGTSDLTLLGAVTNFQSFNTAFGNGTAVTAHRFRYVIVDSTNNAWETGIGYLSGATTLVREVVQSSSNGNAAVNLQAGSKVVFSDITAALAQDIARQAVVQALISGSWMN